MAKYSKSSKGTVYNTKTGEVVRVRSSGSNRGSNRGYSSSNRGSRGSKMKFNEFKSISMNAIILVIFVFGFTFISLASANYNTMEESRNKFFIKTDVESVYSGVTYKSNEDYSITLNGVSNNTNNYSFSPLEMSLLPNTTYTITYQFKKGDIDSFGLDNNIQIHLVSSYGGTNTSRVSLLINESNFRDRQVATFTTGNYHINGVRINVARYFVSNYTFNIQIEKGDKSTPYFTPGFLKFDFYDVERQNEFGGVFLSSIYGAMEVLISVKDSIVYVNDVIISLISGNYDRFAEIFMRPVINQFLDITKKFEEGIKYISEPSWWEHTLRGWADNWDRLWGGGL